MNPVSETPAPVHLHCETLGQGPNLTILHGLFGSGENWRGQAVKLAKDFTVHCLDARNHGNSPHTDTISYPEMAADVAATCAVLGISKTHVLGHSMGGKTAMQLALQQPELIEKLIVVDIGPRQYPPHHNDILRGLSALAAQAPLKSRRDADAVLSRYEDNAAVRAFLLKNLQRSDTGDYSLRINLDVIVNHYEHIAAAVTPTAAHADFSGPALFIKGALSDYLQTSDREQILALFPNTGVKTIGGAGHWPHSEKPDIVYKIISDFLATG